MTIISNDIRRQVKHMVTVNAKTIVCFLVQYDPSSFASADVNQVCFSQS